MAAAFVNFADLKKRVSLEEVLARSGLLDGFTRRGEKLLGPCPLCQKGGTRPFQVSLPKNVWYCFGGCKRGGNVLDFVALKEGVSLREAALALDGWFPSGERREAPAVSKPPPALSRERLEAPASALPTTNPPLTFALKTLDQSHPDLEALGLSKEVILAFGIGHCSRGLLRGRIAIPVHNAQGELVAYTGLAVSGDLAPRYLFPPKFLPALEVMNRHRLPESRRGPLYLVPEILGVLRLAEHGDFALGLFDGSLSDEQDAAITAAAVPYQGLVLVGEGFPDRTVARLARHTPLTWLARMPWEGRSIEERNTPMRAMTAQEANQDASKLDALAREWGMSVAEFIEEYALDDTVPGICMNPSCDYTTAYEPDQDAGWCEVCGTQTVKSALRLAGII